MNEPHDLNRTVDRLPAPADALGARSAINGGNSPDPPGTPGHLPDPPTTVDSRPTADEPASVLPAVPGYRVLREIARGGMGRVLAAYDLTLDRDVALKILLPGANADRFVRESKITARLPHPGIPPVYALGTLADRSPFLAMKLIAGQTLAAEMKTAHQPRLLQVFTQVCQAVGFAHSRGVIHRDLKPSNIMVGAFGEVQVMDWGLAKDLASREISDVPRSSETLPMDFVGVDQIQIANYRTPGKSSEHQTQAGAVLGTPAYMAPEQARGEAADVRADVFALGAILCTILTGKPPFIGRSKQEVIERAGAGDLAETLIRLNGCGADAELITLCWRCINPEAANRPAHGAEVAELMAAYQAGVEHRLRTAELNRAATEAQAAERQKRRRLWIGAAAVLALAVIGGLGAVLEVQRLANAELAAKNAELTREQAKVQARFELAQKAIRTFHTGVSEDVLLKQEQFKDLRDRLLKEAAGFYGELEKLLEGQTDARSRRSLGSGYAELGAITERIGSTQEALRVQRKALAMRRELAAVPSADLETQLDVARSLRAVGILLDANADPDGSLAVFEEARNLAERLAKDHPTDSVRVVLAQCHHGIGTELGRTGKPGAALAAFEQARDLRQQLADANPAVTQFQAELANSHNAIGYLLLETNKQKHALSALEQGLAIRQRLADANPTVIQFQTDLAQSYTNIASMMERVGKPKESVEAYGRARIIVEKLANTYSAVTEFQASLALHYNDIGARFAETGKLAPSMAAQKQALAIQRKLAGDNPTVTQFQTELAVSHHNMGLMLAGIGKRVEALAELENARVIRQKLVDANPTVTRFQSDLARSHLEMGIVYIDQKRFAEAFTALDLGLDIRQKLSRDQPDKIVFTRDVAESYTFRGLARSLTGQSAGAAADLRRAIELWAQDPTPTIDCRIGNSRALTLLAGLGGDAKSGVTSIEAEAFAAQAVSSLRDAVNAGWNDFGDLRSPDFKALRDHEEFKKLLADPKAVAKGKPGNGSTAAAIESDRTATQPGK